VLTGVPFRNAVRVELRAVHLEKDHKNEKAGLGPTFPVMHVTTTATVIAAMASGMNT